MKETIIVRTFYKEKLHSYCEKGLWNVCEKSKMLWFYENGVVFTTLYFLYSSRMANILAFVPGKPFQPRVK
jgi:hypothetical protein